MDDTSARSALEADLLPPRPANALLPEPASSLPTELLSSAAPAPPAFAELPEVEPPPLPPPPPPLELDTQVVLPIDAAIRGAIPWLVSLLLNLSCLLLLALFALPLLIEQRTLVEITALSSSVEVADEVQTIDIATWQDSSVAAPDVFSEVATAADEEVEIERDQPIDDPGVIVAMLDDAPLRRSSVPAGKTLDMAVSAAVSANPPSEKELKEAGSVEEAVDGIGSQIGEMLGEGDLLVVWLLDASLSLVDDRQRVSARLEDVYSGIEREQQLLAEQTGGAPPRLTSAVVAFGGGMAEVVSPTGRIGRAANAVKDIPIDQTGLENVYSAVASCVRKYGSNKRRLFLVIWTDESGDDIALLEPTIALCKAEQVRVSIIGPTAVLGAEAGTHAWIHPESRRVYYLPVKKGPDTALPERLQWPYWWQTSLPAWHEGDWRTRVNFEGWYGGRQLASIASGFPPYSLTRLARETGGSMTILDREIDRGPFRLSVMRQYAPDHRPAADIIDDLRYHPLRQAILKAVDITRAFPGHEPPPTSIYYTSPAPMRRRLRHSSDELERGAEAIEQALAAFGPEPDGMESLYLRESSPRWRAWYDLTRGRLLAQSVRYGEFRALCKVLCAPGGLPDDINCLQIEPVPRFLLGSSSELRAREAERLLTRCLKEHAATPWAYLAQRELDHALGVAHLAFYREPPIPAAPAMPSAPVTLPKL